MKNAHKSRTSSVTLEKRDQIITYMHKGYNTHQIAEHMGITERRVRQIYNCELQTCEVTQKRRKIIR